MPILDRPPGARRPARPRRRRARAARRRDPRDDHRDRRQDRRPPRQLARRGRAHGRAPPAARVAARPDRLGHRPPGLRPQAADRPARAVRHAAPARRRRRLPAAHRVASTTSSTAATPAPACRSPRASPTARDMRHGARAGRGRRRRRGADERPVASRRSTTSASARRQLLIVLNDNEMSISPTVGALSKYLAEIKLSRRGSGARRRTTGSSSRIPVDRADRARAVAAAAQVGRVNFAQPGQLFEDLGHHLHRRRARPRPAALLGRRSGGRSRCTGPVIVHVRTQKGRGYRPAEADQVASTARPCRRWPSRRRTRTTSCTRTAPDGVRAAAGSNVTTGRKRRGRGAARVGHGRPPRRCPTPTQRLPPAAATATPKNAELHRGLRRRADRARRGPTGGSSRSPRACPPAPACRSSRRSSRSGSSTSASPSSTP